MLHTERLTLRGPLTSDLDDMFAIYSNPRAMKFWSTNPHEDPSVTKELLDRRIAHWAVAKTNFQIELDGRYIGNAGKFRDTEVGFMLDPDYWRKGIIREAMGAIIPHLWAATDLAELTADADPLNEASVGVLQSLGFHETHRAKNTFFINDHWCDSVYFSLPRPDHPRASPVSETDCFPKIQDSKQESC